MTSFDYVSYHRRQRGVQRHRSNVKTYAQPKAEFVSINHVYGTEIKIKFCGQGEREREKKKLKRSGLVE